MKFYEYEKIIDQFAVYPDAGKGTAMSLAYCALGLTGEAGEYSEKVKKLIRDGKLDKPLSAKELGDVLWYLTRSAKELGYNLTEIAEINIEKLSDRKERGVLQGGGDTRWSMLDDIEELKTLIVHKLDVVEFLDILGLELVDILDKFEDEIEKDHAQLVRACR
jgi:NTP pyrophosphatase (non-canonical NTP hydrolase)